MQNLSGWGCYASHMAAVLGLWAQPVPLPSVTMSFRYLSRAEGAGGLGQGAVSLGEAKWVRECCLMGLLLLLTLFSPKGDPS